MSGNISEPTLTDDKLDELLRIAIEMKALPGGVRFAASYGDARFLHVEFENTQLRSTELCIRSGREKPFGRKWELVPFIGKPA